MWYVTINISPCGGVKCPSSITQGRQTHRIRYSSVNIISSRRPVWYLMDITWLLREVNTHNYRYHTRPSYRELIICLHLSWFFTDGQCVWYLYVCLLMEVSHVDCINGITQRPSFITSISKHHYKYLHAWTACVIPYSMQSRVVNSLCRPSTSGDIVCLLM